MEQKLKKFNEDLKKFKKFLDEKKIDFMVVGSGALLSCGIPLNRCCNDIDIEVICNEDDEKFFKLLQASSNIKVENDYTGKTFPYIFTYQGIKINVWVVNYFSHNHYLLNDFGVKIASVFSVLKRKMDYRRRKDYEDLNYIIKTFIEI